MSGWEAAADRLMHELDEEIESLRGELIRVEATMDKAHAGDGIRARIRDLIFERDLLPRQRRP